MHTYICKLIYGSNAETYFRVKTESERRLEFRQIEWHAIIYGSNKKKIIKIHTIIN